MKSGQAIECGFTSDNPITIHCSICNAIADYASSLGGTAAYCPTHKWFPYIYLQDRWYRSELFIIKWLGLPSLWDYANQIRIKNK